jgi:hypothetical protein
MLVSNGQAKVTKNKKPLLLRGGAVRLIKLSELVAAGWGFEAQRKADSPHPNPSPEGEGLKCLLAPTLAFPYHQSYPRGVM